MLKWTIWFIFRKLERLRNSRVAQLCGAGSNGTPCKPHIKQHLVRLVLTVTNLCYSTFLTLCILLVVPLTLWTSRGSNPVVGEIFCMRPYRSWGPLSVLLNGYRLSFPGVKRPGRRVDHPPPSSAEVKERVELHLSVCLHGMLQGDH
jgi:hypothetical protein